MNETEHGQTAEIDVAYLRRLRRWMESHPPGTSVTVSRDLVLGLLELAEAERVTSP